MSEEVSRKAYVTCESCGRPAGKNEPGRDELCELAAIRPGNRVGLAAELAQDQCDRVAREKELRAEGAAAERAARGTDLDDAREKVELARKALMAVAGGELVFAYERALGDAEALENAHDDELYLERIARDIFIRDMTGPNSVPTSDARRFAEGAFAEAEVFVAVERERAAARKGG